jgi:uncharacterized membrane protein YbaN (DUF454 family)
MNRATRILLIVCGTLCVLLGIVGMVLPVLPTTPFLLLAAFCYARSSKRFYDWLTTNRWSGEYIRNYREGRGVRLWHKVLALSLLWLTIGYSAWFVLPQWWLKATLLGIAIGVSIHLLRMKTYKPENEDTGRLEENRPPEESD